MRKPKPPPPLAELLRDASAVITDGTILPGPELSRLIARANEEGWNWEDCSYRAKPAALTPAQLWFAVKWSRSGGRQSVPLLSTDGQAFSYWLAPTGQRILHEIDLHLGGSVGATFPQLGSREDRNRYLLRSLSEEAVASSLIEGASVTRQVARDMLRTGRRPRTEGERMIVNNFRTIQELNRRRQEPMTPALLCDVQRMLTEGTLDPAAAGRFRTADERIEVGDDYGTTLHVPPPAEELPARVETLCAFANATDPAANGGFIHPAVRAVVLHFWLGYDHPFVDGNGRTARALFYWSMLRSGYWLTEYLTISSVIAGHPVQYGRAYLNTEADGNDLFYFVRYHLGVIDRSLKAFREYLDRKTREQQQVRELAVAGLNFRQRDLLTRALRDPAAVFTYESHANSHGVSKPTARVDLLDLAAKGLIRQRKVGREFEFTPASDIADRLRRLGNDS